MVLEARRRTLGQEHTDTLTNMGNLGSTYWNQGKLQGAADLEEMVLEPRRRTLGEHHPDTLTSMGNLAWMYHDLRRSTEARLLMQQSADTSLWRRITGTVSSFCALDSGRFVGWNFSSINRVNASNIAAWNFT